MLGSFFRQLLAAGLVASAIGGCSSDDLLGSDSSEVASDRSWKLPAEVLAAGRQVRVAYDAAPAWRGPAACSGRLREGTADLGEYLSDRFAAIDTVGGYACRRNTADTSRMSVHGTGRALDLMIPKRSGAADSTRGDAIANWLVMNAQRIGVQLIIWNRTVWRSNGSNTDAYGGPHPHDDHIHVEITNVAARRGTPWFASMADTDAGASDASGLIDGAADDDDASMLDAANDAAKDASKDVTAPQADAGTTTSKDSGVDASKPPAQTTDSGTTKPDDEPEMQGQEGSLAPEEADPGGNADGYDFEVPEGEGPADDDALSPSRKRRSSAATDEETTQSKGCSAAPLTGSSSSSRVALLGVLAVAFAFTRRSKRS